jgi:hypothetical protein
MYKVLYKIIWGENSQQKIYDLMKFRYWKRQNKKRCISKQLILYYVLSLVVSWLVRCSHRQERGSQFLFCPFCTCSYLAWERRLAEEQIFQGHQGSAELNSHHQTSESWERLHISETLHLLTVRVSLCIGNRVIGRRVAGNVCMSAKRCVCQPLGFYSVSGTVSSDVGEQGTSASAKRCNWMHICHKWRSSNWQPCAWPITTMTSSIHSLTQERVPIPLLSIWHK